MRPQVGEQRIREAGGVAATLIHVSNDDQPFGLSHRQHAQEGGVDQAEDSGVGADSEREAENRDGGEAGALAHRTECIAQVQCHGFDQGKGPPVPIVFLHRVDASETAHSGIAGLRIVHPALQVVFGLHLQMEADLILQLALQAVPDKRCQSSVSVASCLRPAALME